MAANDPVGRMDMMDADTIEGLNGLDSAKLSALSSKKDDLVSIAGKKEELLALAEKSEELLALLNSGE